MCPLTGALLQVVVLTNLHQGTWITGLQISYILIDVCAAVSCLINLVVPQAPSCLTYVCCFLLRRRCYNVRQAGYAW